MDIPVTALASADALTWNRWKMHVTDVVVLDDTVLAHARKKQLVDFEFTGVTVAGCTISATQFLDCNFERSVFRNCTLSGPRLSFTRSRFNGATFTNVTFLEKVNFTEANFNDATFDNCTFIDTGLIGTSLVGAIFNNCTLKGCYVYGTNCWDITLINPSHERLRIESVAQRFKKVDDECITVDDLQLASFIHLLINRERFTDFFNTVTTKCVLILGRFADGRLETLNVIADVLKKHDLIPIIFDFKKPKYRNLSETVTALAGICQFVVADLTKPESVPNELRGFVPSFSVPVIPIIQEGYEPYSMFRDLQVTYGWVLKKVFKYRSNAHLQKSVESKILKPAYDTLAKLRKVAKR